MPSRKTHWLAPALLACLASSTLLAQPAQPQDPRDAFGTKSLPAAQNIANALSLMAGGKLKDAKAALAAAEKLDPACAFIYYQEGSVFADMGDVDLALVAYKKAYDLSVPLANSMVVDAATSLGIVNGQLKKYPESEQWFSRAIVADPADKYKLLGRAYRNLSITLINEKHFANAALTAIMGYEHAPKEVEVSLVEQCIKNAQAAGETEISRCLFLDTKFPAITARPVDPPMTAVTLAGEPITKPISQFLADPQGRFTIAIAPGEQSFYLLTPSATGLTAKGVPAGGAIQSACLINGHFYLAEKDPPRLAETDPLTGKPLKSWKMPAVASSIAVFPSAGYAYFPNNSKIWSLNLKTSDAASTDADGQVVAGSPNEHSLFARIKDEHEDGGSHFLTVNNNGIPIYLDVPTSGIPTMLFEFYCSGDQLIISQAREAASANGYDVSLSSDGQWVGIPGGGGWRSDYAVSQKLGGYVIPIFAANDFSHLQGAFSTDAYPNGLAVNCVTHQVAAIRGQDVKIYSLASAQKSTQTITGKFNGPAAFSGDGRFLFLASDKGLVAWQNTLSKEEQALATLWWQKIGPAKSAAPAIAAAARQPLATLANFQPTAQLTEVRKVLTAAQSAKADRLPAWDTFAAYTADKAVTDGLADIIHDSNLAKGTRLFRLKELAKDHPASLPLKYFLADALISGDQADAAKPLLLEVVHADKGQTELSGLALNHLSAILLDAKQTVQAAHCAALAFSLDRGSPESLASLAATLPAVGLTTELEALKVALGSTNLSAKLPTLADPPADAAPLATTALYENATHSVVLIKCRNSSGSGACIGDGVTILTSLHVVSENVQIDVYPFSYKNGKAVRGDAVRAVIIAKDEPRDLAVLRLAAPIDGLTPLPAAAKDPVAGQKVYAVGNPGLANQTLDLSITDGIISAADRPLDGQTYLQHTAGVNPGNSGGPLLNEQGQIVGVVCLTAKLKSVSFATPISQVRDLFQKSPH